MKKIFILIRIREILFFNNDQTTLFHSLASHKYFNFSCVTMWNDFFPAKFRKRIN